MAVAPDDDAPRQVLADALLERGDVRGEFIALQLLQARGAATEAQDARAEVLFENHWRRWLSEVPGVGGSPTSVEGGVRFHRGFLRDCVVSPRGVGADSPAWRMVERIDVADLSPADVRELAAPALTRLEVLTGLDFMGLQMVVTGPEKPRLRELGFAGPWMHDDRGRQEQRLVLGLTRFASLRLLSLSPRPYRHHADWLEWLFAAPLVRQLERVRLWMELPFDVAGLHALLIRSRLESLKLELVVTGVRLVMDAAWLTVQFDNEFWFERHAQALRNLSSHFAPFPYRRFDVKVGSRPATRAEIEQLGDVFAAHTA